MAGSLTYREYTSDAGVKYSIKVDKSNADAVPGSGLAQSLCVERAANDPPLPSGLSKRYILCYAVPDPLIKRKFYVGNPGVIPALIAPGATINATEYPGLNDVAGTSVSWIVTAYRGEKSRNIPAFTAPDTGLNDGTVTE